MIVNYFTVSMFKDWVKCPQRCVNQHILRRVSPKRSDALTQGTIWHAAMEAKARGEDIDTRLEALNLSFYDREIWNKQMGRIAPLVEFPEEEELIGTEVQMQNNDIYWSIPLIGRLDAIVKFQGKYWHRQYKTLSATVPVDVFSELCRVDWHESAYETMLKEKYGEKNVGGTILYIARKINQKQIDANPKSALAPAFYLQRQSHEVERAMYDMQGIAREIMTTMHYPIRHTQECGGPYRNSLCPYFSVCHGVDVITNDSLFNLEEDRYAVQDGKSG